MSIIFYATGYDETKKLFAMPMLDVFVMMDLSIIWTCYRPLQRKYVLKLLILDRFYDIINKCHQLRIFKKILFILIGEYSNIVVHQKKSKSAWHNFIQQHFWDSSAYEIQHKCSIKSYYSWIWLKLSKSLALGNAACTSHCGRKTCSFVTE